MARAVARAARLFRVSQQQSHSHRVLLSGFTAWWLARCPIAASPSFSNLLRGIRIFR